MVLNIKFPLTDNERKICHEMLNVKNDIRLLIFATCKRVSVELDVTIHEPMKFIFVMKKKLLLR